MVFGNMGETSATGVAFTRDPSTGERAYYGEYLINAQGEDVVAGIRTPQYLTRAAREKAGAKAPSMEETMPEVYRASWPGSSTCSSAIIATCRTSSSRSSAARCGCCRPARGKRTAKAALRIAVDMARGGADRRGGGGAARRSRRRSTSCSTRRSIPTPTRNVIAKGLPASPGAACGKAVFDADTAEKLGRRGREGDPGPHRDPPGGHSRHARRRRASSPRAAA